MHEEEETSSETMKPCAYLQLGGSPANRALSLMTSWSFSEKGIVYGNIKLSTIPDLCSNVHAVTSRSVTIAEFSRSRGRTVVDLMRSLGLAL